ncbi:uncharacterized protein LOC110811606 isoform X2 [Carica papaya]|uniref:uncharacterized protein LOC110811606 isoform X2 n=1 Tax=Carica papaya TaxID=3649 RepID=UPI000B8CCA28|nr:uncharacterized protein LOC110811606 isoform X2 [Carica papaya]
MDFLTTQSWSARRSHASGSAIHLSPVHAYIPNGANFISLFGAREVSPRGGSKLRMRAFATRKAAKKLRRGGQRGGNSSKSPSDENLSEENDSVEERSPLESDDSQNTVAVASRNNVLQACIITSGLIAALGVTIRQLNLKKRGENMGADGDRFEKRLAGWKRALPFEGARLTLIKSILVGFEIWHLELVAGLVVFVTSCRYLLLRTWPEFAESSEVANQQVLTSLEPLDYLLVAFFPGISEELLFRGALLPLFGINWKSVFLVAGIFGILHLGGGRKYSFAVWATFVGIVYGWATIVSSSIFVAMGSHALNNLLGGILWRYTSKSLK